MTLDPSLVGRSYPPTAPHTVTREKIREFAGAVGDTHPAYTDPAAARALGHPDVIAPPTFVFVLTSQAEDRIFRDCQGGTAPSAIVHSAQRFTYSRPVRVGDRVVVSSTVRSLRSVAGSDILEIGHEVRDDTGEHLATAITTLVLRHAVESTPEGAAGDVSAP